MRVVVLGATGNVGTAVVEALREHSDVEHVVGVARRLPGPSQHFDGVTWLPADISRDPLPFIKDADVVVHLAWKIQPSHDETEMQATNVDGTRRVLDAVSGSAVGRFVYASSVGAYAPGPKLPPVDESWPVTGVRSSTYSRHKATVEAMLDGFEAANSHVATVRMRTSLVFQRKAASEVHRLFLGRWAPWRLPGPLRLVPRTPTLVAQAAHAHDVADAYVRAVVSDVRGPFNVAADPPLTPALIAEEVGARLVPALLVRAAYSGAGHLPRPAATRRARVAGPGYPDPLDGHEPCTRDARLAPTSFGHRGLLRTADGHR